MLGRLQSLYLADCDHYAWQIAIIMLGRLQSLYLADFDHYAWQIVIIMLDRLWSVCLVTFQSFPYLKLRTHIILQMWRLMPVGGSVKSNFILQSEFANRKSSCADWKCSRRWAIVMQAAEFRPQKKKFWQTTHRALFGSVWLSKVWSVWLSVIYITLRVFFLPLYW